MTFKKLIDAVMSERESRYSSKLYTRLLKEIANRYASELVEYYLVRIDRMAFGDKNFVRVRGSRVIFKTKDVEKAFKLRNLLHSSGYKNSRVRPLEDQFQVVAEAPDNIILSKYFIEKLREGDEYYLRLILKFLKDLFLRNIKRIKLLLKNTKF